MKKAQQGFTLIELLVAIAIIGILSSILLISVSNARKRSIETASQMYARNMVGWAVAWMSESATRGPADLPADCQSTEYIGQGAPATYPSAVKSCQIQLLAANKFGVLVTSANNTTTTLIY